MASVGLTNGVYLRCDSFDVEAAPVATITLLHKSLPDDVWSSMILAQQTHWVQAFENVQVATRLAPGEPWPADARLSDRWTEPDGGRLVVDRRKLYIWYRKRLGDLPVFKTDRNRSAGMKALINNSATFDHRKEALRTDVPCNDVTRQVSDAVVHRWHKMCDRLRARPGRARVGETILDGSAKKVSALQPRKGPLHTHPGMVQADSPETFHWLVLNSSVVVVAFVRQLAEKHDPDSVLPPTPSYLPFSFCKYFTGRRQ